MFGCKFLLYILFVLIVCMIINGLVLVNIDSCSFMYVIVEFFLISLYWFFIIFVSVVYMKVFFRIWDLFFYEGFIVFF